MCILNYQVQNGLNMNTNKQKHASILESQICNSETEKITNSWGSWGFQKIIFLSWFIIINLSFPFNMQKKNCSEFSMRLVQNKIILIVLSSHPAKHRINIIQSKINKGLTKILLISNQTWINYPPISEEAALLTDKIYGDYQLNIKTK